MNEDGLPAKFESYLSSCEEGWEWADKWRRLQRITLAALILSVGFNLALTYIVFRQNTQLTEISHEQ